jgi:hypothetical protein
MSLDWNSIDKSSKLIDSYFFYPFYDKLNAISREYRFIQLSAPFVGAVDGVASLVQATGGVGEATIKGSRNLLQGALSCNTESLKRGSLQIVLGGGLVGIVSIPIIFIRTLRITAGMLMNPVETTHVQAENYRKKISISPLAAPST